MIAQRNPVRHYIELEEPEYDTIAQVAAQLDLLASLATDLDQLQPSEVPGLTRPALITVPAAGLAATFTQLSDRLRSALETAEAGAP